MPQLGIEYERIDQGSDIQRSDDMMMGWINGLMANVKMIMFRFRSNIILRHSRLQVRRVFNIQAVFQELYLDTACLMTSKFLDSLVFSFGLTSRYLLYIYSKKQHGIESIHTIVPGIMELRRVWTAA